MMSCPVGTVMPRLHRATRLKRQAGLRTWTQALGSAGLPAAAEARIMRMEAELRQAEARLRDEPQS
jgi:hypothetical protein